MVKMTKEQFDQRELERKALKLDSQTRMHRVVKVTALEAVTLSESNYCMQCGHRPVFHTMGAAASFCQVKGCHCEVWNMDYETQQRREKAEREALEERCERLKFFLDLSLAVSVIALAFIAWMIWRSW